MMNIISKMKALLNKGIDNKNLVRKEVNKGLTMAVKRVYALSSASPFKITTLKGEAELKA